MKVRTVFHLLFIPLCIIQLSCNKCILKSKDCELEPDSGPCEAYITKYYYDKGEKKCQSFLWGGCEGEVPFNTLEECKKCVCNN